MALGNREGITIAVNVGHNRQADITRFKLEAEAQPVGMRLPFIPQCVPRIHDLLVVEAFREANILEDNDPRVFEFLRVSRDRDDMTIALWHKCNVCRKFEYPCETDMWPERRYIKCSTCEVRVHRHCQKQVLFYYNDGPYRCTACIDGL